jgi:hypothetical protein
LLTAISVRSRHVLRALALWLGLAALMVQSLAPAYARTVQTSGATSIVICTAHGFQTVQLEEDGNALAGKSSANAQDCCTDCQVTGGFIVPTPVRLPEPFQVASEVPWFAASPPIAARFYSSYVTRGPPSGQSPSLA